jgi:hypothetical protein
MSFTGAKTMTYLAGGQIEDARERVLFMLAGRQEFLLASFGPSGRSTRG